MTPGVIGTQHTMDQGDPAMGLVDPRDLRHVEDWLLLGTDPEHPCR